MFFRIWCLYLVKLAVVCLGLSMAGSFVSLAELWEMVVSIASYVAKGLGLVGAGMAVWYAVLKKKPGCPMCGAPGHIVVLNKSDIGVECESCGLVHADALFDFRMRVEPLGSDENDEN